MNKILLCLSCMIVCSCTNNTVNKGDDKSVEQSEVKQKKGSSKQSLLKVEYFTELPSEIEGCACYFYRSNEDEKSSKYIFVNDFANTAFMSINGILDTLTLKEHTEGGGTYDCQSKKYRVKVRITTKTDSGHESESMQGVIYVTGNGETVEVPFVGMCGC